MSRPDPHGPGSPDARDPRAEELSCLRAQEEEFLRAADRVPPEDRARLERLERAVREAAASGGSERRRRSIVPLAAPVLAAAAAVAILVLLPRDRSPEEEPVLRGDSGAGVHLESVVAEEQGRPVARFRWEPVAGADSYAVVILDADRSTVARLDAGDATAARWEVPPDLRSLRLECVLVAYREGREVERSPAEPVGGR